MTATTYPDSIAVLDFGSQYSQLITRRVREMQVYCELFAWNADSEQVMRIHPRGFILSGGPSSVYEKEAPSIPAYVLESKVPILGICYGMQALAQALGGKVASSGSREYGLAEIKLLQTNPLILEDNLQVWMSHGDRIETAPAGFSVLAESSHSPIAAMGDDTRRYYGLQFHPEVRHTRHGQDILNRFVINLCAAKQEWTPLSMIEQSVSAIQAQVGNNQVLSAVSGGVDSSVATALVHKAAGSQLQAVFVDTGLLRQDESRQVEAAFKRSLGTRLHVVDASQTFFTKLAGITEPEAKRRIIGETFIRIFEEQANRIGKPRFLVQGTIYPDVVEFERTRPFTGAAHQKPPQCGRAST